MYCTKEECVLANLQQLVLVTGKQEIILHSEKNQIMKPKHVLYKRRVCASKFTATGFSNWKARNHPALGKGKMVFCSKIKIETELVRAMALDGPYQKRIR
ncbi:hypothetical protein BT93_B3042 [Corymbia citriodora subsp. variegata]|nr:hypothetical protein BT93_B3042 [Corymbia citriodora subsp. variegata]